MATWSKLFSNFAWKNKPDTSTPLGQTLLNRLNTALNGIDDRVVALNTEKAYTDDLNGSIVNVRLDEKTGIFTFTRFDGTTFTINTALEEVVTNFVYDYATQSLVLTLADGTTQNVNLSALITQYEFTNSATILFTVGNDGKVTANIKPNSITDQMLQTNYLADITTQANTAVSASQSALESQSLAEQSAEDADRHADRAEAAANRAESIVGFTVDTELSTSSTNPIANKAVAEALENVDAKTLDGHGAEYFVAKDGSVPVDRLLTIGASNTDKYVALLLKNLNRSLEFGITQSGAIQLHDATNKKNIFTSGADGTNTWNGTASENIKYTDKPTGTYTGNGDAAQRIIATGSIGNVFVVRQPNTTNFAIVTASGYIGKLADTVVCGADAYANINLVIKSVSQLFNESGVVYEYYSL